LDRTGNNIIAGAWYTSGDSIFRITKVNKRKDGSLSINSFCYGNGRLNPPIYSEDLPISILRAFDLIEQSELLEELLN
jgi:hypothetical protein